MHIYGYLKKNFYVSDQINRLRPIWTIPKEIINFQLYSILFYSFRNESEEKSVNPHWKYLSNLIKNYVKHIMEISIFFHKWIISLPSYVGRNHPRFMFALCYADAAE